MAGLVGAANNKNTAAPKTYQPNQQDQQVATPSQPGSPIHAKFEKAKDLIGSKVVNDKGEQLGTVADIVLTSNRDAINYVALSHGGTWGVAEKYFAVPWSQFSFRPGAGENERVLVLKNVSKADLDRAPGFDKSHWPATASANWLGIEGSADRYSTEGERRPLETDRHPLGDDRSAADTSSANPPVRLLAYQENRGIADQGDQGLFTAPPSGEYANPNGSRAMAPAEGGQVAQAPATQAPIPDRGRGMTPDTGAAAMPAVDIDHLRLSKLFGTKIENLQGEDLGKLDNAMIDTNQGKIAFGIVAVRHGFLGLNKDYVPVPWSALDMRSEPGVARLDANKDTLMALAFDKDNFPNLEDPQYSRQLYDRFHVTPYGETYGFVPGEERRPDRDMSAPDMTAPGAAPNSATPNPAIPRLVNDKDDKGKHALSYNPNTVETIRGTVQSVDAHKIKGTAVEELRLHVKTDAGKMVAVAVGPRAYVERQNISFRPGDPVTITGSLVKSGNHEMLLASQIQAANKTLNLRGTDGKPLWNPEEFKTPGMSGTYGQMHESHDYSHGY
jgi:sporulation protein YlmC with PRC-barrel domain